VLDAGVVQADAVTVDVERSFHLLNLFLQDLEDKVMEEIVWLQNCSVDAVIIDAPFAPLVAAKVRPPSSFNPFKSISCIF
jgi:hypothetical protein